MLKSIVSLVVVVSFCALMSCGGGSAKQPSDTVKAFTEKVEKADYDSAIDCLALNDEEMDEETKAKLSGLLAMGKAEMEKKEGVKSMEVVSEEIDEEAGTAKVEMKFVYGNGDENTEKYNLVQEDGKWKLKMN
jgi:hypothetical protein